MKDQIKEMQDEINTEIQEMIDVFVGAMRNKEFNGEDASTVRASYNTANEIKGMVNQIIERRLNSDE